jgi:hypothetical protein
VAHARQLDTGCGVPPRTGAAGEEGRVVRIWHGVVALWFVLAGLLALGLATGFLDPFGSAYYGIVGDPRVPYLLLCLAAAQGLALADAVLLGWRRRRAGWWAGLLAGALTLPAATVLALAWLDVWRYGVRRPWADAAAGLAMALVLAGLGWLRRWAWRRARAGA